MARRLGQGDFRMGCENKAGSLHITNSQGEQKLSEIECKPTGTECEGTALRKKTRVTMYFNGPTLVQLVTSTGMYVLTTEQANKQANNDWPRHAFCVTLRSHLERSMTKIKTSALLLSCTVSLASCLLLAQVLGPGSIRGAISLLR